MKTSIRTLAVTILLTGASTFAQAQPGDPGPNPGGTPTDVPFDGGLSLIAAAGIAYAAKKGYEKRKVKK